jgi:transcriptional regulator
MDRVQAVVDFVNLMTYDFRTSDPIAGHHANLSLHPADTRKRSVASAVGHFIAAGVPPGKVVVGVPFYGRAWADIKGEGTGPYQPGSRPTARLETRYGGLSTTLIDRNGFARIVGQGGASPVSLEQGDAHVHLVRRSGIAASEDGLYPRQGVGRRDVLGVLRGSDRRAARHALHGAASLAAFCRNISSRRKGVDRRPLYVVERLLPHMPPKEPYRNRIELLQGTLDMLILRTLQWGPQHGHGIGLAIRAGSSDVLQVEHGSLYPALHRLERQRWIVAEWKVTDNKQRAKYYRLTALGRKQLVAQRSRWRLLVGAIAQIMDPT